MKQKYLLGWLLLLMLITATAHAQTTFEFTYNECGHRVTRAVIALKSAVIPGDTLVARQNEKALEDQIGLQQARIFPNPTKGMLRIDLPTLSSDATIRVFDSRGTLLMQQTAVESGNTVDLSARPSGFYILTIHVGQEKKEWKIIKE